MGEIAKAAAELKLNNPSELVQRVGQMSDELKEKEREIESLNSKLAALRVESLFASAKEVNGVKIVTAKLEGVEPAALRVMCDKVLERSQNCVAVIAGVNGAKANIAACAGKDAQAKGCSRGQNRPQRSFHCRRQRRRSSRQCNGRCEGPFQAGRGACCGGKNCCGYDKMRL